MPTPTQIQTVQHTASFDGCGINLNGRRILTGSRADWDEPEFVKFCQVAAAAPAMLEALKSHPFREHHGDERGPCLCGQCKFVRDVAVVIAQAEGKL